MISTRMPMRQVGLLTGKTPTSTPKPEITSKPEKGLAGIWDRLKTWVDQIFTPENKTPTSTPETLLIQTEVPIKTPKMTQPPSPTPTPTPTPVPTPSERERRALAAVNKAIAYADDDVKYTKGGTLAQNGFDCSGLVKDVCDDTKIVFGQGHVGESAQGMVTSFLRNKDYASIEYDYTKDTAFPTLMPGDLVFSAEPEDLSKTTHVTMATGNKLQVVEASDRVGIEKVTDEFNAYDKTNKNGLFVRNTNQIIIYVFRPYY